MMIEHGSAISVLFGVFAVFLLIVAIDICNRLRDIMQRMSVSGPGGFFEALACLFTTESSHDSPSHWHY